MKTVKFSILGILLLSLVLPLSAAGGQQSASGLADIGFNASGLPIVSKPFTMSAAAWRRPMHAPFSEMESYKRMETRTGVHIQWIELPEANFAERKNLMLASNDLPDVFWSGSSDADILRYGYSGIFIPQEKLIEQYAPRLVKIFNDRPEVKKYVTTPDGHIYTLPVIMELAHRVNPDNMFINKVWLDKLGLQMPNTYDEFYNVLKAFKDRDPNGNGLRDEIPMSFYGRDPGNSLDFSSLFAGFGMFAYGDFIMVSNGKVYFTGNTAEYRNALVYFNRMYSVGLIDPEAFTHDVAQYSAKGQNPDILYGVFFDWFDENCVGNARAENDYVCLPPLLGIDGKRHWRYDPAALLMRDVFAITSKMKNPEVATRWANECYDLDNSYELAYGAWGVNLRREGDRVIQIPPPPGLSADEFRYLNASSTTPYMLDETAFRNLSLTNNHIRKFARLDIYRQYFPTLAEIYPRVFFLQEEETELSIIRTDIKDYLSQMRGKFIVGSESISTGWNAYVSALNQMGLNRYLELYQRALDRYNAN